MSWLHLRFKRTYIHKGTALLKGMTVQKGSKKMDKKEINLGSRVINTFTKAAWQGQTTYLWYKNHLGLAESGWMEQ